ncbi:MAG: hypothetical protein CMM25_05270 [Rhodospirillaceae bacterium]|nr:hypothetical protein [Rhodospirillaceae bacterium]
MVYFLTNKILKNYIYDVSEYVYSNNSGKQYGHGIALELLEINYPYYILYNSDKNLDIRLITDCNDVTDTDVVIFYNCSNNIAKNKIDFKRPYKKIQIVTDQPLVEGCDSYISYDPTVLLIDNSRRWYHVMYPMPIGLKKCKPVWPPEKVVTISPGHMTIDNRVKYDIIDDSFANNGDEDILFHVRKKLTYNHDIGLSSRMKFPSHKTANRLYQSWYCNVPGVFSTNPAMDYIRQSEYDFLEANCIEELDYNINRLQTDEKLFMKMVNNCKLRENENSHSVIVDQWLNILNEL